MGTEGNTLAKYCPAHKRQGEGLCTRPAGWGTDHVGIGRCKLHGGCGSAASLRHGMHSRCLHAQLAPLLAQYADDPEPLNLFKELAVARAFLSQYCATHATLEAEQIDAFSKLLENVTKTVARIEKIRGANAIRQLDLVRMWRYLTVVVEAVVDGPEQVAMIKHRWGQFRLSSCR